MPTRFRRNASVRVATSLLAALCTQTLVGLIPAALMPAYAHGRTLAVHLDALEGGDELTRLIRRHTGLAMKTLKVPLLLQRTVPARLGASSGKKDDQLRPPGRPRQVALGPPRAPDRAGPEAWPEGARLRLEPPSVRRTAGSRSHRFRRPEVANESNIARRETEPSGICIALNTRPYSDSKP